MKNIDNSVCLSDFSDWIKTERERRDLSQEEVAARAGITQSCYSRIESQARVPTLPSVLRICKALDLDFSDFTKRYM